MYSTSDVERNNPAELYIYAEDFVYPDERFRIWLADVELDSLKEGH